jgi:hypothetical protein
MLVTLLAVLFMTSGAVSRHCMAAHHSSGNAQSVRSVEAKPPSLDVKSRDHTGHDHASHDRAGHDHANHGGQAQHSQFADEQPADDAVMTIDDATCSKCCGTCTLVTGMVTSEVTAATFAFAPVVFPHATDLWSEAQRRVDPEIPKPIV